HVLRIVVRHILENRSFADAHANADGDHQHGEPGDAEVEDTGWQTKRNQGERHDDENRVSDDSRSELVGKPASEWAEQTRREYVKGREQCSGPQIDVEGVAIVVGQPGGESDVGAEGHDVI